MTTHTPLRCVNSFMIQRGSSEVVLLDSGAYPGVSNFQNGTWTWNGTDWTQVVTAGPLPGRTNQVMAYDGYGVMVYGGQADSALQGALKDTWIWSGSTWTQKSPTTSPFGRYGAEACRTTTTALNVTMFGGYGGQGYLNETWKWDGYVQTWTQLAPATSPSARVGHVMAAGPTFTVLFGGSISSGECKNDTWKFDGTTWTLQAPATSPSVRTGACMAYDVTRAQWVLFGGVNEYNNLPETWLYDGTTWTKATPATSPAGRKGAQMCWDSQSGNVIMFGGISAVDNYASDHTWSWNGTTWTKL